MSVKKIRPWKWLAWTWIVLLVITFIFARQISPYPDDVKGDLALNNRLKSPSLSHIFGTDSLGRDILTQLIYGTRIDLTAAFLIVSFSILMGVPLGLISGYSEGIIGGLVMRISDTFLSFPPLILPLFLIPLIGNSILGLSFSISLSWWPWYARVVRSQVLTIKHCQYVEISRVMGAKEYQILIRHLLPNTRSLILTQASMDIGYAIIAFSTFSFLGLGVQPPLTEWGLMLMSSRSLIFNCWWTIIFPALAIFITILSFNLIGDSLREYFDPIKS